jgi:hypothetical protein
MKSRATTIGSFGLVADGDELGSFVFIGDNGETYASKGVEIGATISGTPSSTSMPTKFYIRTTPSGSVTPVERVAIVPNGNCTFSGTLGITGTRISNAYYTNITSTNALTVDSDETKKTDIVDSVLGLDFINALRPVSYKWLNYEYTVTKMIPNEVGELVATEVVKETAHDRTHYGLVAQDIEKVMADLNIDSKDLGAYVKDEDGKLGIRYGELIAPLIKAIQELSARIKALEA